MTWLLLVMQLHMLQHVGERGTADATGSKNPEKEIWYVASSSG